MILKPYFSLFLTLVDKQIPMKTLFILFKGVYLN